MSAPPTSLARHVVSAEIHCRRCGYNLYGLAAGGVCPECGLETWETILHTVDPASSRLPRLRDPAGVGDALLALSVCLLTGALALSARPAVAWIARLDLRDPGRWLRGLADWAPYVAALSAFGGLLAVRRLARPPADEPAVRVRRDLVLTGSGLLGAGVLLGVLATLEALGISETLVTALYLLLAVPGVVGLVGLGGLLEEVGRRSREYRTARGGRQGVHAMIAALVCLAVGRALELPPLNWRVQVIGATVSSIGALMLLIGLAYLVVNAMWIRRSLRRPPPRLEEILAAGKVSG